MTKSYGLIGKNISYSFSKKYFTTKFEKEGIEDCTYKAFDLYSINQLESLLKKNPTLKGLNVTIPYKEKVLPFLDKISKKAKTIGAVNTIKINKKGKLKGYNTDFYGFKKSLKPLLEEHHKKALILGTGGASKAIAFALDQLGIDYTFVSRQKKENVLPYSLVNATTFDNFQIIINTTPLGTFPSVEACPSIPYEYFTKNHIAFDLIYNPEQSTFLKNAQSKGATIKNGYDMLVYQAEKSWEIWNRH